MFFELRSLFVILSIVWTVEHRVESFVFGGALLHSKSSIHYQSKLYSAKQEEQKQSKDEYDGFSEKYGGARKSALTSSSLPPPPPRLISIGRERGKAGRPKALLKGEVI